MNYYFQNNFYIRQHWDQILTYLEKLSKYNYELIHVVIPVCNNQLVD